MFDLFGMIREKGLKMKINVLRLIEDALIGGRNGEMAFIENNPFIAQLFRESKLIFKDFLLDCLNDKTEQYNNNSKFLIYNSPKKFYNLAINRIQAIYIK